MSDGRQRAQWGHTSAMLAMIYNTNCSRSSECRSPNEFNPFTLRDRNKKPLQDQVLMMPITVLKDVFVKD